MLLRACPCACCQAFLSYHVYLAVICGLLLFYYMYAIRRHAKGVLRMFRIEPDEVVTGRFEVETSSDRAMGNHDLFPTILDVLHDMCAPRGRRASGCASADSARRLRLCASPGCSRAASRVTPAGPTGCPRSFKSIAKSLGGRKARTDSTAAALHKPSQIAQDMVGLHQSPHLDLNDSGTLSNAGGLDGWFASTFGTNHLPAHAKLKHGANQGSSTQGSDDASSSSCTSAASNVLRPRAARERHALAVPSGRSGVGPGPGAGACADTPLAVVPTP